MCIRDSITGGLLAWDLFNILPKFFTINILYDAFVACYTAAQFRAMLKASWQLHVLWQLQVFNSCSSCSLSSWKSTSVRVSWPYTWSKTNLRRYEVRCIPDCGISRVPRSRHTTIVRNLRAGTNYVFRVINFKRYRSVSRSCSGTTSLYSLHL